MIEVKEVDKDEVEILTSFGWQATKEIERTGHRSRGRTYTYQVYEIERDKDMPNYDLYVEYQNEYYNAKNRIQEVPAFSFGSALLLLLIFIVPGVLYILLKILEITRVKKKNNENVEKMNQALENARNLGRTNRS